MSTVIKDLGAVSAYAYAVEKGYTGTEAEFAELMADYAEVGQRAENAAGSALESKTTAQTAAATATTKAGEAATSAQTATTKAGEAQTSAQTASSKASEASQSASQASGYAQTAETAKTDAQTAKTQAETARDNAVTAKTAAETAQGKAEDAAESVSASAAQIATNTAEISELKNDGVVPSAEQLLSKNTTADAVPYLFRQTGGDGADREYLDAVVGGTVNFNQIANTPTVTKTFTETATYYVFLGAVLGKAVNPSHKYFLSAYVERAIASNNQLSVYVGPASSAGLLIGSLADGSPNGFIQKIAYNPDFNTGSTYAGNVSINNWSGANGFAVGDSVTVSNIMVFDLTAMFGSTIADCIYSLEQATAGAGVAFFKSLFPNDYYPYNAGELKSVEGVNAHETVGFNQWDEEWEVGGLNPNGTPNSESDKIRSKNYIPVVSGATYYFCDKSNALIFVHYYDAQKQWISSNNGLNGGTLTLPDNCSYIRFRMQTTYGTTYNHDICINISDPARNGEYEPYVKRSYPLDSTLTLRGISKMSDGKMYFDGDRYLPDGTVERRYGIRAYQSGDESLADAITDGTNTVYKLTATTIEEATLYRQLQICDPNGTEEFVSTGIVPVGHETRYPENLRAKIEGLPWDFSSLIAPTESAFVATRNYVTGDLFIVQNVLYKATSNIANGGTITPNTNCTATTLAEIISALA